jgi:hypothetical protein
MMFDLLKFESEITKSGGNWYRFITDYWRPSRWGHRLRMQIDTELRHGLKPNGITCRDVTPSSQGYLQAKAGPP